ncbi:PilZ domain-containing protein [Neiella marina]|uniref:PilZ domain-containing protein n=1 Tax=Neiella holothuriorum TaxID=2870530 RepID=A0ABS7EEV5_9GAMM|nr:PilZ domain-containing protein [Neiella holothuriorum]MBW8190331.1 PilZ domain-containing protein [Neiella holothuriorum]
MDHTDYFSVNYQASINVKLLPIGQAAPDDIEFQHEIPQPFLISAEVSHIDSASLRSLRKIADASDELADYLANQSRKIDVILSYVLQLQDNPDERHLSESISAGGLTFMTDDAIELEQVARVKVFLPEQAVAIYAYAKVVKIETADDRRLVTLEYCKLRDDDQEHLIRATLHIQTKQLQQRRQNQ